MDYSILLVLGLFYSIIFLSVLEIFPCLLFLFRTILLVPGQSRYISFYSIMAYSIL